MAFVLDASLTATWCFPDERNGRTDAILEATVRDEAWVPIQWWFELRNVLLSAERRARSSAEDSKEFLEVVGSLPIHLAPLPDEDDLMHLARRHRLTFYDAAYLELAKRQRLPLATLDRALAAAAQAEGVTLVAAG